MKNYGPETPGCLHYNHMNNAGASLMPTPVIKAIKDHIDLESQIGGYEAHAAQLDEIKDAYGEAAKFLNCKPDNIAYVASATDAFARALSSIPFNKGDVILTSEDDYISNQIMYLSLQKRLSIRLERVPCDVAGGIDIDQAETLIRKFNPKLVAVTHIPTNSGLVQDVKSIGEVCEKYDVTYLVDACQSVGQLPVDVREIKCDFLSATMRKFLRGPRGAGFLFVSDKALQKGLEPLFIDMQGAEWIESDNYKPHSDGRRFEDWEFAYALVQGSGEAFKYASQIGMENISPRVTSLAATLRQKLSEIDGIKLLDRGKELCAIVTCQVPATDYMDLKRHLQEHKINAGVSLWHFATIDFQKKGVEWALRLAPHYYNTDGEVDEVVDVLRDFRPI